MAHGVESLAYDWERRNLYWTDSQYKWIMATEESFRYYSTVYKSQEAVPIALALHAKKR